MRFILALLALIRLLTRRRRVPTRRRTRPRTITVIWVEAECEPWSDDEPPIVRLTDIDPDQTPPGDPRP